MRNYEQETTGKLKFLLWANLQDNMRRSEIIDNSTWEDRKRELSAIYEQTEKEISAIRAELCKRGA